MRRWTYIEQGDNGEPVHREISDDGILATYFHYWCKQMQKANKAHLISPENCIDDFVVVYWATEKVQ